MWAESSPPLGPRSAGTVCINLNGNCGDVPLAFSLSSLPLCPRFRGLSPFFGAPILRLSAFPPS